MRLNSTTPKTSAAAVKNQAVHDAERRDRAGAKVAMRKISIGDVMGLSWTSTRRRGESVQHRQRIDDGGGVHPELHAEADGNRQIAVLRR